VLLYLKRLEYMAAIRQAASALLRGDTFVAADCSLWWERTASDLAGHWTVAGA